MASVVTTQTDFSAGEIDVELKRYNEHPALKAGARQMVNWRILNTRGVTNRPGRRALYLANGRVDRVTMSPGNVFDILFSSDGKVKVYNSSGTQVFSGGIEPWGLGNIQNITWVGPVDKSIYITMYLGNGQNIQPLVLTWDGVVTWTLVNYVETVTAGNQKRTFFYRISPKNITMQPSATTGTITLTFRNLDLSAANILLAGHVGTRMRFVNRQLLITQVLSPPTNICTAIVQESLPPGQTLTFSVDPTPTFNIGDLVIGSVSNARGIVTAINAGAKTITVQLTTVTTTSTGSAFAPPGNVVGFTTSDNVVGPGGALTPSAVANTTPQAVSFWDDEVMNLFRGYPGSCFQDQGRLGFCNFPSVPRGIGWSAFGLPNDLYVDATVATGAMFELVPGQSQVFHIVPGPESNEFVFCDNRIHWIPISVTNPLKPGSVAFNQISTDGAANVQPRRVEENIIYLNSGLLKVKAVIATGSYTRPYETGDLSELHTHLLNAPIGIAVPNADSGFPERYVYVLNVDGSVIVGKYSIKQGTLAAIPGWLLWKGNGTVNWISANYSDVVFSSVYSGVAVAEILDSTVYIDASQLYNTQPSGLPRPVGKGPLWWFVSGSVDLMDGPAGTRMMGTYQVDANGFLIPQNNPGEDFTSVNLRCGQAWAATLEPFIPPVQAGQDMGQRMWPRRLQRVQSYVRNSTGFTMQRLYGDQSGPKLPLPGTVMKARRIATWNVDEDPTQQPTLREQSYLDRPLGRSHDPRWALVKDTPGPIEVLEISTEVTL